MAETDPRPQVLNPLPGVVWLMLAAVAGIESVLFAAGQGWIGGPEGIGWRLAAIARLGFAAEGQAWMIETGHAPAAILVRYIAYPWVQPAPSAAGLAFVMLAALGKAVAEGQGARVVLAVALVVPPIAAAAFGAVAAGGGLLVGAMPLVFGLVGALARRLAAPGADPVARRRALSLMAVLLAVRGAVGLWAEAGPLWVADLVAVALGFALAAAFAPGGARAALARMRRR
jgi:rhomboid protease GluP